MNRYATAPAFRQSLEQRLRKQAERESTDLMRLRRQVAFDRLLARIFSSENRVWALKGGYALELRFAEARATRDIDLSLRSPTKLPAADLLSTKLQAELQRLAGLDLGDFFGFAVAPCVMNIDGAPYGGARFPVDCRLAGRTFVRFHVDIGVGDIVAKPTEALQGHDWLGFAGIPPPKIACISIEQQFAEKLHAFSRVDRAHPNSRVKDLIDLVMMIRRLDFKMEDLGFVIALVFSSRFDHVPPKILQPPPDNWQRVFAELASEVGLEGDINQGFNELQSFCCELHKSGFY